MPFSQTVAAAYADTYSVSELNEIREAALEVYTNSATVSRSCEGLSLTIDKSNAESVLENVQEALRIKQSKSQGCDPDLCGPVMAVTFDRSHHRIR